MLVDAAKHGDVEIPVFCYEPKLGNPVGACRMCLVEIEGIPKLQTGCSTPVKDGMVVAHAVRARAHRAGGGGRVPAHQPSARLPGVRQGRRVPAAGHHLRLGRRHLALHRAQAPLSQAAGAVAAGRHRPRALHPVLPLRALLPGDRRGLPARAARARRALLRGHLRRPSLRGPVQRQHHRAVPGRGAHLAPLPLPGAALGHRGRRARCARCAPPSATCTFTVRDERVLRVLARDHDDVDDGWLCDKGRFGYQSIHVDERDHPAAGARRRRAAARCPGSARWPRPPPACAARAGGCGGARRAARRPTRRASCSAACCARAWTRRTSTAPAAWTPATLQSLLAPGRCRPPSPTSSSPTRCSCSAAEPVDDAPILDLRIRKGVRRNRVAARGGHAAAVLAGRQRRASACATPPAARPPSSPRWPPRWTAATSRRPSQARPGAAAPRAGRAAARRLRRPARAAAGE